MDHRAHEYSYMRRNIDNFMGYFNHILLKEFVDYSLIFMRSRYSVGFSNIVVLIYGIMTEFVMPTLDENVTTMP